MPYIVNGEWVWDKWETSDGGEGQADGSSRMTDDEQRAANAEWAAELLAKWKEQGRQLYRDGFNRSHCFDKSEREGWDEECAASAARFNHQMHTAAVLPEGENW